MPETKTKPRHWRTVTVTLAADDPGDLEAVTDHLVERAFDLMKEFSGCEAHVTYSDGVPDWVDAP